MSGLNLGREACLFEWCGMVLGQSSVFGYNGTLQTLGDQRCVDPAGALDMDVLHFPVQVCQHLGTQSSVGGLSLQGIQLSERECVQGARRGCLACMEIEGPSPEQITNLHQLAYCHD